MAADDRVNALLRLSLDQPELDTGCGRSWRFGGAALPCGILVHAGGDDLTGAYIVTTKSLHGLHGAGPRLVAAAPVNMTPAMMGARKALNDALSPRTRMYRNVYTYGVDQHSSTFDAATELASMRATDWSTQSGKGKLGKAFEDVRTVLTNNYGTGGYTMTPFRILRH